MRDSTPGTDCNGNRRRFLRGLAATGIGLAAVPSASGQLSNVTSDITTETAKQLGYGGFEHWAMGEAELENSAGSLLVSNASPGDGVTANVGEAEAFTTRTTFDEEREPGSALEFWGRGVVDGEAGQPIGMVRTTRIDDEGTHALQPDFGPLGADSYSLSVYDDGELVHAGEGFTDPTVLYPPDSPSVDYEFEIEYIWTGAGWIIVIRIEIDLDIVGPDDLESIGDEIRLTPDSVDVKPGPVTDVSVIADGPSEFAIHGETVGVHGHDHRQVGNARLSPSKGGEFLGVENLAESDGVAVGLGDGTEAFGMELEPVELGADGVSIETGTRGIVDGRPNVPLGTATFTGDGEGVVVNADFTPVEADGVRVVALEDGEVVGETEVASGQIGRFEQGIVIDWTDIPPHPLPGPFPIALGVQFDGRPIPVPLVAADGTELAGDELRLEAVDPGVEVAGLSEFQLTGHNVEQLGVIGEQRS